jgi:hypothetical protein
LGGYVATRCDDHESCIVALVPRAVLGPELGGAWHLEWSEPERRWRLTSPIGRVVDCDVSHREDAVLALAHSVEDLVMAPIVGEIMRGGLFPP